MEKKKKKWVQPELTVLVRSKPEEAVLDNCKMHAYEGGPTYDYTGCSINLIPCGGQCSSKGSS